MKYAIGVDFGTLSGRAVLVDVHSGQELAAAAYAYPHGVMDKALPDGTRLGLDWALQHPQDYLEVLSHTIPEVLRTAGVKAADVIGVGVDVTACTLLPVLADGTPLCSLPQYRNHPHAYVKLWKHHAAQDKADRLNRLAEERGEAWLARYGGKTSSEWLFPKLWEVLEEAPDVYQAADYFVEAVDWLVWQLTGRHTRCGGAAGYKGLYHKRDGYPGKDFFRALDPRLENVVEEKLAAPVLPLGTRAGVITAEAARLTGLAEGTAVAVGNVDAHVTAPAAKIDSPGQMLAIIGTSTCHIMFSDREVNVPGICGVVEDGVYPGYYGYEAGQPCVGDLFGWFVENCLPAAYLQEAKTRGKDIHAFLTERAECLHAGESGLLALEWWNGNRSVLADADLSGMLLGMTLQTRPEEIYRALIESTAFGTRKIIETFRGAGVPVHAFYASGGIPQKNAMLMQIYADVIGMPICIADSRQGPALGSAIFGAVAAGREAGGEEDVFEAVEAMGRLRDTIYTPIAANTKVYDRLYAQYCVLHDALGQGRVMKELKEIKRRCRS